jgi:hypothetical protein
MMRKITSTLAITALIALTAACGRDESADLYDPAYEEPATVTPVESYETVPQDDPWITTEEEVETLPEDTIPVEQPAEPLDDGEA